MFNILADCSSRPSNVKGFVSLAVCSLILFFSDICQWNKMSVLSAEHLCSTAPFFYSLPYQSAILPSQLPMDVTLCMCLSQEKSGPDKKMGGVCSQNCEKQHGSGLPFALNEALASRVFNG